MRSINPTWLSRQCSWRLLRPKRWHLLTQGGVCFTKVGQSIPKKLPCMSWFTAHMTRKHYSNLRCVVVFVHLVLCHLRFRIVLVIATVVSQSCLNAHENLMAFKGQSSRLMRPNMLPTPPQTSSNFMTLRKHDPPPRAPENMQGFCGACSSHGGAEKRNLSWLGMFF